LVAGIPLCCAALRIMASGAEPARAGAGQGVQFLVALQAVFRSRRRALRDSVCTLLLVPQVSLTWRRRLITVWRK
jgi:hypothetical protein